MQEDRDSTSGRTNSEANLVISRKGGKLRIRQIPPENVQEFEEAYKDAKAGRKGVIDVGSTDRLRDQEEHRVDDDDPLAA